MTGELGQRRQRPDGTRILFSEWRGLCRAEGATGPPARAPGRRAGYSLMELLVVMAIMAVLLTLAFSRFDLTVAGQLATASLGHQLTGDLRLARHLAISHGKDHLVRFFPAGGPYGAYQIILVDGMTETPVGDLRELGSEVTVTGDGETRFTPLGSAVAATTYTLVRDGHAWQVTVAATTGQVRIDG